jgi:hypothetical protein
MYVPRRYRRKLLFPPGLLALGFLLLLGSMRVARDQRLRPQHVLQLNMISLHPDKSLPKQLLYPSKQEIEKLRRWDDLMLTGNTVRDSLTLLEAYRLISIYQQDILNEKGLRIYFHSLVCYRSLVKTLDIMALNGMKKYWFDMRHDPIMFYAITSNPEFSTDKILPCGSSLGYCWVPSEPIVSLSFWQWLDKWATSLREPATWQPLADPTWRNSLYIFLLLSLISVWKMARSSFY